MNKLMYLPVLALATLSASAELPADMHTEITDTDAAAIYLVMDDFEATYADATSKATYDAYPDGLKVIGRRMDFVCRDDKWEFAVLALDSIMSQLNTEYIYTTSNEGNTLTWAYKKKSSRFDNTIDMSDLSDIGTTAAAIQLKNGSNITLAQTWTINTGKSLPAPDLTALTDFINRLSKIKGARTTLVELTYSSVNGNGVRVRPNRDAGADNIDIKRISLVNIDVDNWINLHHQFMAYFGADANISLTYIRNERFVSIIDYDTKTIYAAKWRQSGNPRNGNLYIVIAKYTGQPYLPEKWWISE